MNLAEATAAINTILEPVAKQFIETAAKELSGREWKRAYFDVRFSCENNSSGLEKSRAVLFNGEIIEISSPKKGSFRVMDAYRIRRDILSKYLNQSDWWYGVVMHAFPDGTTVIEFLYDQDCLSKGFGENRDILVPPPRGYEHYA